MANVGFKLRRIQILSMVVWGFTYWAIHIIDFWAWRARITVGLILVWSLICGGSWSIKVSYGSHEKVGKENESHCPFRPVHFTHGMYTKRKWNFHSDLRHIFATYVTMFSKSFLVHHVCEVFFKKVREATKKFPWPLLKQEVESIRGHSW